MLLDMAMTFSRGNFTGSAGSSIDRAFNFKRR
jgi:hypothetical protein